MMSLTAFCLLLIVISIYHVAGNTCDVHSDVLIVQYRADGTTCTIHSSESCIAERPFSVNEMLPLGLFQGQRVPRPPDIKFCHAEADKFYTVMMVDPDAPYPESPTSSPWLHWLVVNILGENLVSGEAEGDTKKVYAPPAPPKGVHHYEFLLYPQTGYLSSVEMPQSRARFDIERFKKDYRLGDRVAVNGFRTGKSVQN